MTTLVLASSLLKTVKNVNKFKEVNKAVSYSCHVYFETNTKYYVLILLVVQVILGVKTRMQE